MVKGPPKKVPWVPEFLRNNHRARVGLGVLVEPGKEPDMVKWRDLWVQRVLDLWEQTKNPREIILVQEWEELQGGWAWVWKGEHLVELLDMAAPALWETLYMAVCGDQEAKNRLLEKFPQEDPAPSLEEQLWELEEAGLEGLAISVVEPHPVRLYYRSE